MLLPAATAEQECTGFHPPIYPALRETSGTVPGQPDQPRRPAVTPFLTANVAHPKRSGNLHRGDAKGSVETAAANPTLLRRKQSGFTVTHRAARWGGRGEDNPRAEETQLQEAILRLSSQHLPEAPARSWRKPVTKRWTASGSTRPCPSSGNTADPALRK